MVLNLQSAGHIWPAELWSAPRAWTFSGGGGGAVLTAIPLLPNFQPCRLDSMALCAKSLCQESEGLPCGWIAVCRVIHGRIGMHGVWASVGPDRGACGSSYHHASSLWA